MKTKTFLIYSIILAVFFINFNGVAQQTNLDFQDHYVITNVNVIDVRTGNIQKTNVIVKDDRIEKITIKNPNKNLHQINAEGKFMIPGLWEMHGHIAHSEEESLTLYLINGITGIRDMGGDYEKEQDIRKKLSVNGTLAPTITYSSPILEGANWLSWMEKNHNEKMGKKRIGIKNPKHAVQVIDSLKKLKFDHIKIRTSENLETYLAILKEVKKANIEVVGHTQMYPNHLKRAAEAGQISFEHTLFIPLEGLSKEERQEIYKSFKENNSYICPTFIPDTKGRLQPYKHVLKNIETTEATNKYLHPKLFDLWREQHFGKLQEGIMDWKKIITNHRIYMKEMYTAGIKMVTGTDVVTISVFPGESLHEELEQFVSILGMTPLEALQSSIVNSTKMMHLEKDYGSIEKGKKADLLLLNKNPLENISNTQDIYAVIKDGKYIGSSEKKELLKNLATKISEIKKTYKPTVSIVDKSRIKNIVTILSEIKGQKVYDSKITNEIEKILTKKPKDVEEKSINSLAYAVLYTGAIEQAIDLFKLNIKNNPESWNAYDSLGEVYMKIDEYELGRKYYRLAMQHNPHKTDFEKKQYKFAVEMQTFGGE